MTLSEAKNKIKKIIQSDKLLPIYLHGSMGLGKSSICKQIADELGWKFLDIRLSMMSPTDLLGIPYANKEHTKANWLYPSIFPDPKSKEKILILFDELSLASPSVQGACFRIILDRSLGEHYKFPDGVKMIAAGNLITDNAGVQRLNKALANRFIHFNISEDIDSWKGWGYKNGMNTMVLGFINWKKDMLFKSPTIEQNAFPTPRTYEYLSRLLEIGINDLETISGTIGDGAASEFLAYCEVYNKLPSIEDILAGKKVSFDKNNLPVKHALSSSLVISADEKTLDAIVDFCVSELDDEFLVLTMRDISRKLPIKKLANNKKFQEFINNPKFNKYFCLDEKE